MDHLIRALTHQLERIADTYEAEFAWRKSQVGTVLSREDQAALKADLAAMEARTIKLEKLDAMTPPAPVMNLLVGK